MGNNNKDPLRAVDKKVLKSLPPGVKLVRSFWGDQGIICPIVWSPDGLMMASSSKGTAIRLWDTITGECLKTLQGHRYVVSSISIHSDGCILASGSIDCTIKLWELASGKQIHSLEGHAGSVYCTSFNMEGNILASGGVDKSIKLWDPFAGKPLRDLVGHRSTVYTLAFNAAGSVLASGGADKSIKLWEPSSGKLIHTLEGHTGNVCAVAFDDTRNVLVSGSDDKTIKIWEPTGKLLSTLQGHVQGVSDLCLSHKHDVMVSSDNFGSIHIRRNSDLDLLVQIPGGVYSKHSLALNPICLQIAATGSSSGSPDGERNVIHIYELDPSLLKAQATAPGVAYKSAKIVLVGDSGVGKTGLGWRLAHGKFKEHSSTHGHQFWVLKQLSNQRSDGTQCEAVLWDLAGQDDYRLTHALFLDDADLALVLFNPSRSDDPLGGVEYWLKQLKSGKRDGTPSMLIAARADRGTPRLTTEELQAFCRQRGIKEYLPTSAKKGEGIEKLIENMQRLMAWDDKPATITTETFKLVKDFILGLKENQRRRKVILTPEELRKRLAKIDRKWEFTDKEMLTAVEHLANHGCVTRLKTSLGEPRILLAPELLNNLAASFVLEARRSRNGLGSLEEEKLLSGGYTFPELAKLIQAEKGILLDSAAVLFLDHNVCFRETDPLNDRSYLVFPELINLKKPPIEDDDPTEDGPAYTVSGSVENVYASLVVLMGYTQTFTRINQWHNQARYEVGKGFACGFRQEAERPGELDFVLYFSAKSPEPVRKLFQSLFENFLGRRNLTVRRIEPVVCPKGHKLNRNVVRDQLARELYFAFCSECGEKASLPRVDKPIQLSSDQAAKLEADDKAANRRSHFEQVLFRLKTYVTELKMTPPECFISYAWGNTEHEHWVERLLATDLQKAGIVVVLDRWDNARPGASVPRFVERVAKSDRVLVVGTPIYQKKYDNKEPMRSFVVGAEGDLIGKRMIGTEAKKESVIPVLLEGSEETAFPYLLQGRVYADFRNKETYFETALELFLSLYGIKPTDPVSAEFRASVGTGEEFGIESLVKVV